MWRCRVITKRSKACALNPFFRRLLIHRPNCLMLNLHLENLFCISGFATRSVEIGFGGSMSDRRVRCHFGKIPFLGMFVPLLVVVAVLILFRADMLSVAANSTLKCYDSAGNHEPCITRAGASLSRSNGRTAGAHQLASWTATALYKQTIWTTPAVDQPANWTTTAVEQPADRTTSAPAARRSSSTIGKHPAICRRRLIPCFFSALRRGFTHLAAVAATAGHARPARERL